MTCRHCGGKNASPGRVCGSGACIQRRERELTEKALRKVEREMLPGISRKQRAREAKQ